MYRGIALILLLAAVTFVRADEKIPLLKAGNTTYTNVTVTSASATDLYFNYAGGMGNVKLKDLSPELQQHFGYNAKTAKAVADRQATNQAIFQQQLAQQPAAKAPDMSRDPANYVELPKWQRDLAAAIKSAHDQNKFIFFDFTGSDWCPGCIQLEHDVLSTKTFQDYADKKLICIRVDFPHNKPQSDEVKQENQALQSYFGVQYFPTCVLINGSGVLIGGIVGYDPGTGMNGYIAKLEEFINKK